MAAGDNKEAVSGPLKRHFRTSVAWGEGPIPGCGPPLLAWRLQHHTAHSRPQGPQPHRIPLHPQRPQPGIPFPARCAHEVAAHEVDREVAPTTCAERLPGAPQTCLGNALGMPWECLGNASGMHWECLGMHWECIGNALGMPREYLVSGPQNRNQTQPQSTPATYPVPTTGAQ